MANLFKNLLTKSIIPLMYTGILIFVVFSIKEKYQANIFTYLITVAAFGLPIGLFKTFIWLVPFGAGAGETMAIIVIDIVLGAVLGSYFLFFYSVKGIVWLPFSFYRYFAEKKAEKNFFS